MMNPKYHFTRMHELLDEYELTEELARIKTKLQECEVALERCQPKQSALERDQTSRPVAINVTNPVTPNRGSLRQAWGGPQEL